MCAARFAHHFADLPDPRVPRSREHALLDILVIALLGVLCGAEGWEDMERFGLAKHTWLRERLGLGLENGIPSDDTFRRLFARLDPERFDTCFRAWVHTLREQTRPQGIALDGKVLRHSFDSTLGQSAIHLVRAWATDERLVLGTLKVEEGSNEIPALTTLLSLLDLRGSIVTADALHCQRATAVQILEQGGEYLLALKGNQPNLAEDVAACFSLLDRHPAAPAEWQQRADGRAYRTDTQSDFGHARREARSVQVLTLAAEDPDWKDVQQQWPGLRSLIRITRTRCLGAKQTTETVYYLSSLVASARRVNRAIRRHWQIENCLHYVLDVAMNEDACRIRVDHAPENFARLRAMALNLLRQEKTNRAGVKARQKLAGWDQEYLLKLIA